MILGSEILLFLVCKQNYPFILNFVIIAVLIKQEAQIPYKVNNTGECPWSRGHSGPCDDFLFENKGINSLNEKQQQKMVTSFN